MFWFRFFMFKFRFMLMLMLIFMFMFILLEYERENENRPGRTGAGTWTQACIYVRGNGNERRHRQGHRHGHEHGFEHRYVRWAWTWTVNIRHYCSLSSKLDFRRLRLSFQLSRPDTDLGPIVPTFFLRPMPSEYQISKLLSEKPSPDSNYNIIPPPGEAVRPVRRKILTVYLF
jgi:hypothetical protein